MKESNWALAALSHADSSVELGPVGVAAVTTDACRAYQALCDDERALAALEPQLQTLVREGTPAAIIYAALLLRRLGRDTTTVLAPYRDDRRPCMIFPGGCGGTTHWLCEAVRWVTDGIAWSHPERLMAHSLANVAAANWFELPSGELMDAAREHRRLNGRMAAGQWTLEFAVLLWSPQLPDFKPLLVELSKHPSPLAALHGALLLKCVDDAAGQAALDELARTGVEVLECSPKVWNRASTRPVHIADLVARLRDWTLD